MSTAIVDAKAELEAAGLTVRQTDERSLWVAATTRVVGQGIRVSNDASVLLQEDNRWVAVFPAGGQGAYEVRGQLPALLSVVRSVYAAYRRRGGLLADAFKHSVPDADSYLAGGVTPAGTPGPAQQSPRLDVGTDHGAEAATGSP